MQQTTSNFHQAFPTVIYEKKLPGFLSLLYKSFEDGKFDKKDNVLKNAPHTAEIVTSSSWKYSYTREKAAYPLPYIKDRKFWPSVSRIDNAHGDRNLFCSCAPLDSYES